MPTAYTAVYSDNIIGQCCDKINSSLTKTLLGVDISNPDNTIVCFTANIHITGPCGEIHQWPVVFPYKGYTECVSNTNRDVIIQCKGSRNYTIIHEPCFIKRYSSSYDQLVTYGISQIRCGLVSFEFLWFPLIKCQMSALINIFEQHFQA